ncbi:fructose-6-phosphate aldolase [Oceanirhabdus sp. W0125-5]|uniref:fructose-6-phosphate aldolase n=1 Tax=Oceanirhabdus sp. W0125-5 TaxID=2999116 RepID=UPI0022F2ED2F|nr:fructose-6-phosphate aldolase [Oceanirhabdus sp. W0125-5]WBW97477.1 fructose-6-phosphate aldolase [Oceanirhabdus sp. W0125-5]
MKIFVDTANVNDIRRMAEFGILDGATTNPSLIAKEGRNLADVIEEICGIVDGPISAEVISEDHEGMIEEGKELAKIHKNVVIKIPMCEEGIKAVYNLNKEGIKTNVTLIFSVNQALIAAKAGATYVSPFLGRVDDIGYDGINLIYDIREVYDNFNINTEIISASIRHPMHVQQVAKAGSDIATIPPSVIEKMFKHPLTDIGIEKFLEDAKK